MENLICAKCPSNAAVYCGCQLRPLPLCRDCTETHQRNDAGNHSFTLFTRNSIQPMNDICDDCEREPAESVCSCLLPLRKYCAACKGLHIKKSPCMTHSLLPVQVLKKPFSISEFEKISEMVGKTNYAKEKLRSNFAIIECCREEIMRKTNELIEEIRFWQTETLSEVEEIREKVEKYIENLCSELDKSMFDVDFVSENGVINLMRSGTKEEIEDGYVLFRFKLCIGDLENTLKSGVSLDFDDGNTTECGEIEFLPVLKTDSLVKFQFPNLTPAKLRMNNAGAIQSTALIVKDPETLFGIGGEGSNSIFSINITSNSMANYPQMSAFRSYPGVICINNALLVFGGYHDCISLKSCERLELSHSDWEPLGNMINTRHGFNPVQRKAYVYLIGGYHSQGCIETYHLQSGVFKLLRWRLLHDLFTCAFGVNDEIIILNGTCQYSLSHLDQLILISDAQENVDRWSCIQPIRYKQDIYFVRSDKHGVHEMLRWNIQCRAAEKVLDI